MLRTGDTIEYLADVSSPLNQKGTRGQLRTIDLDIQMWTARFLLRAGKVRLYNPASPLKLKKTKKGPKVSAAALGPDVVTSKKVKSERRTEANGQRKKTNKAGDTGPAKSDSQGGV